MEQKWLMELKGGRGEEFVHQWGTLRLRSPLTLTQPKKINLRCPHSVSQINLFWWSIAWETTGRVLNQAGKIWLKCFDIPPAISNG